MLELSILGLWQRCQCFPLIGNWFFHRFLAWFVPYTGSVRPRILELSPGKCRVQIQQHRKITNHLNSIHAVALMNLAEVATGIALISALPKTKRAILVNFEISFKKKARGIIEAAAELQDFTVDYIGEFPIETIFNDESGQPVGSARALWLISEKQTG